VRDNAVSLKGISKSARGGGSLLFILRVCPHRRRRIGLCAVTSATLRASCSLKPVQRPHPPIWVGAFADPAIERAARLGDCGYIGPSVTIDVTARQMELYRRALGAARKPFPAELPLRREVFVARTRDEAFRLCQPYLGAKYAAYHSWAQELPSDDVGLGQGFDSLAADRFLIGTPDEVAEQIVEIHRRLGVNHLVMSTEWAGMPHSLAIETIEMIASELIVRVRQGL
jgi:alkanesulfonate monooxygenase SsuD/methylene tetrahydromethanopterin reductase-like flavin-dependent oxidoreductase (luciferase family)